MKKLLALVILGGLVYQSASAIDLKQSKFTQVVNSVEVISSNTRHTAAVNDVFKMPDVMRTGPSSRAELIADDGTITRVGANTIFSFDPAERTIDMQQGSLLFHAPHGKGGGTIRTGSATASVIGTTIIVTCTPNGGLKVLDLEGEAEIRFLNGLHETLQPGQMTFILPGGTGSPIIVFRLDVLTQGSLLLNGFKNPLPSWPAILNEITQQLTLLLDGRTVDTDLSVGDNATPQSVQTVMNIDGEGSGIADGSIIGSDHTPNQPLPQNYTPLDPAHTQTGPFTPPADFSEGLTFLGLNGPSSGFVGNNIDIDTANIDLGAFSGNSDFDIMAAGNLKIWQSLYFSADVISTAAEESTSLPGTVALFAADTMAIAPDSTLEADTGTFGLVAGNFATLNTSDGSTEVQNTLIGVQVYNDYGNVGILSQSDLTMENGSTVFAGNDINIQSDGSLKLGGEGTVSEAEVSYDYDFAAGADGSITIEGTGGLTLDDALVDAVGEYEPGDTDVTLNSFAGDINVNDSDLVAGTYYYDLGDFVPLGGSIEIDAAGNVMLCDSDLYAILGTDEGSGIVSVRADEGNVNIEDTYIDAGSDVSIESADSLTLGWYSSDEIYSGGSINLLSDTGDVYVDYSLYANSDINITSGGSEEVTGEDESFVGGNIDVEYSDIEAGYDGSTGGNVNINAYNGNVTLSEDNSDEDGGIYAYSGDSTESTGNVDVYAAGTADVEDTYIYADNTVDIDGAEDLTVNSDGTAGEYSIEGFYGITLTSDDADVSINNYNLDADDGNVDISGYGDLSATADDTGASGSGTIDIEYSTINAGIDYSDTGSVCVTAPYGGINLYDDTISAYSEDSSAYEGKIYISAGDNVIVGGSDLYADGNVTIKAYGDGSAIDLTCSDIYAGSDGDYASYSGGSICVAANYGSVCLYEDGLYADSGVGSCGDIKLSASGGDVSVKDSTLEAMGNVRINAEDSVSEDSLDSSSGYGDVYVNDSDIYAGYGSTSSSGNVCIDAGGNVTIKSSDLYAADNIDINGGNSDVTGDTDVKCSYIYAGWDTYDDVPSIDGGDLTVNANSGNVCLYSSDLEAYAGGDSVYGSVNVWASGSGDIEGTYIYADNTVDIETGCTLTVNSLDSEATIEGKYGTTLTSDYGDVNSDYYIIQGDTGNVNISAGNDVDLYDDGQVYAGFYDTTVGYNADIMAQNDVSLTGGESVEASGNVYICANGYLSATPDTTASGSGAIDIEDATIYAGQINTSESASGGSIKINANDGGVNIYDDEIHAYSEGSLACDGAIKIKAADNVIVGGETYIVADGNADITTGGSVAPVDYGAGSCAAIDVDGSYIYAGGYDGTASTSGGSICLESYDGDISVNDGSGLYALAGYDSGGNIKLSSNGNVGVVGGSTLEAMGNVYITAGSTESLPSYLSSSGYGDVNIDCSDIYAGYDSSAGGSVCINAGGKVTVKGDSDVYAYDNVDINAGGSGSVGDVDIQCSYIDAGYDGSSLDGGNVGISSCAGNVCISDSEVEAFESDSSANGYINVYANDNIDIACSTLSANADDSDQVNLTAENGYVKVYDSYESSDLGIDNWDIWAGTCVKLAADDSVGVYDSSITANDGDVTIKSYDGAVDIEDNTSISASGNVCITAGGTSEDFTTYDGGVDIDDSSITAGGTIYVMANSGNVCIDDYSGLQAEGDASICATGGGIYVKDYSSIVTDGSISLNADDNIKICDSYLSASENNTISTSEVSEPTSYSSVCISSGGCLTVDGQDGSFTTTGYDIGADHKVSLYGNDSVNIDNAVIETLNSDDSCEKIDVSSDGNICINESTLTGDGSISVVSDGGDISIYDGSSISAYDGDVTIGSACQTDNIKLSCDDICSADDVYIEANDSVKVMDSSIKAYDGDVDIEADAMDDLSGGMLTIDSNNSFYTSTELSAPVTFDICASGDVNLDGDYVTVKETAIKAGDAIYVDSYNGNVKLSDVDLVTYGSGVYLSADEGDLTLESGCADYGVNICAGACVDACATGNICITDTGITADMSGDGGMVKIAAGNNLYISDSYIQGDCDKLTAYNSVSVGSTDIYGENGNVIITSGNGNNDPGEYIPASAPLESPAYIGFSTLSLSLDNSIDSDLNDTLPGNIGWSDYNVEYAGSITFDAGLSVTIDDATLVADTGDVNITSGMTTSDDVLTGGDVNIVDGSTIQAEQGNVYVTANNISGQNVLISGSTLEADEGDVNINATGTVDVESSDTATSYINASQDVSITSSGGMVIISDGRDSFSSDFSTGIDVYAQGVIDLAGNCVSITDTALYAQNDNYEETGVSINSYDGNVELQGAEIGAYQGDINIYASYGSLSTGEDASENGVDLQAGGSVILGADYAVCLADADVYAGSDIDVSGFDYTGVSDSYLEAGGNVCITSVGDVCLSDDSSEDGIYSDGGDITVKSWDGDVYISDSNLQAYGNVHIGELEEDTVLLAEPTGNVDIMGSDITAEFGTVSIEAGDSLNICDSDINGYTVTMESTGPLNISDDTSVTAGDTVSLSSDFDDLGVYNSTVNAGGNNITVSALDGNVNLDYDTFNVAYGEDVSGDDISICDESTVEADGSVCITANGGTVDVSGANVSIMYTDFNFGGNITISGSSIYADDGDVDITAGGTLSITSDGSVFLYNDEVTGGDIMVCDSEIEADYGDVNIQSGFSGSSGIAIGGGTITIGDSGIFAYDEGTEGLGNVNITTPGDISVSDDSDISADEDINITSGGSAVPPGVSLLTPRDSGYGDVDIDSSDLFAGTDNSIGGSVNINAGGNVTIADGSEIYAYNDVNINAGNGVRVLAFDVTPTAGRVDIESSDIEAGYVLAPAAVDATSAGGNVTINAYGNDAYLSDDFVSATSGTSADGDITITADGNLDVLNSGLNADGQVSLTANNGYVNVYDSYYDSVDSSDLTLDGWTVSAGSYVSISADQDVEIDGGTITANGGDVDITSLDSITPSGSLSTYNVTIDDAAQIEANGSVNVYDYTGDIDITTGSNLTADTGNIVLNAVGNVDVDSAVLSADEFGTPIAYTDESSESATGVDLSYSGGSITITAGNDVTLNNDTINLGPNINITGSTLIADTGDVDMTTGLFTLTDGNSAAITGCVFTGGSINISGDSNGESYITATGGNINLDAGQNITIGDSTISATPGGSDSDFANTVDAPSGAIDIVADGGNINLTAVNNVTLNGSTFDLGGNINVTDSLLQAGSGDLDLTTGELTVTAGGVIDESGCSVVGGAVEITAGSVVQSALGNVNINAEDVTVDSSLVGAAGAVNISAGDTVAIQNTADIGGTGVTVNAANVTGQTDSIVVNDALINAGSGTVALNNTGSTGDVHIENGSEVVAGTLTVNSGDGILIDGLGNGSSGNTMNLTASLGTAADDASGAHTVTVQNTDLTGYAEMNVQGHTVNLNNDTFSSAGNYNFTSFYHEFFINNGSTAGAVNFVNDNLNTSGTVTAITGSGGVNPSNNGGIVLGGTGAGIHIN